MNSKQKGKRGELELVHELEKYGYKTRRGVQYNGFDGSPDLVGLDGIHIECKRVQALNITNAMNQAVSDARPGLIPTVFHRKNNEDWYVTMRLKDWVVYYDLYKMYNEKEE